MTNAESRCPTFPHPHAPTADASTGSRASGAPCTGAAAGPPPPPALLRPRPVTELLRTSIRATTIADRNRVQ